MKFRVTLGVLVFSVLSSCAVTPVAYKVNKVVDSGSTLLPVQFPLGITQEKLKENRYRITAKLNEVGTNVKAHNMAMYHASLLAQESGFDAFILNNKANAAWCQSLNSAKTAAVKDVTGGPTVKLVITLVNSNTKKNKPHLFLAAPTKVASKTIMDQQVDEVELEKTSNEIYEYCAKRAKKRAKKTRVRMN